jgi:hypothetical protein
VGDMSLVRIHIRESDRIRVAIENLVSSFSCLNANGFIPLRIALAGTAVTTLAAISVSTPSSTTISTTSAAIIAISVSTPSTVTTVTTVTAIGRIYIETNLTFSRIALNKGA